MSAFVDQLEATGQINSDEARVLRASGITDADELESLAAVYPDLHKLGVRIPVMSNLAATLGATAGA